MADDKKKEKRARLRIILITLIITLLIFTSDSARRLFILGVFIILNFLLAIGKRVVPKALFGKYLFGIELVMFCTIITSVSFGSKLGALMGSILMIVNYVAERRLSPYFFATILLYSAIGYSAYFFRAYDIVFLGITATIIYNIVVSVPVMLVGANKTTLAIFSLINIFFNALIFSTFGRIMLQLLSPS